MEKSALSQTLGLTSHDVTKKRQEFGFNELTPAKKHSGLLFFLSKFANPLIVILLTIAIVSLVMGQVASAVVVLAMMGLGVLTSFFQEYKAEVAVKKLQEMLHLKIDVYRDGKISALAIRELVPGDVVKLTAGTMIPADLKLFNARDVFVNEASLTGESLPLEKDNEAILPAGASLVSGTGLGLVLRIGANTEFGKISQSLAGTYVPTNFDKGIKDLTWMLVKLTIILTTSIFFINLVFKGNFIEALLFSLAVAVGLTPEMLPAVISINLAKGASDMAKKHVIVKRLNSIQNFGSMNVLCTDKTGTLTEDHISLIKYCDGFGKIDETVYHLAYLNSLYQTGLQNPLDKAVLSFKKPEFKLVKKIDELPFDFNRRLLSVVVETSDRRLLITKGAPEEVFKRCTTVVKDKKFIKLDDQLMSNLSDEYQKLSSDGFRVVAIAYKELHLEHFPLKPKDESQLIFKGFMAFLDPPKPTAGKAIKELENQGIALKILSGDNATVTKKICSEVGLPILGIIAGGDLVDLSNEALSTAVTQNNIFVRLNPSQKELIVKTLRSQGNVVGFLGDGINDAPAIKAADVGISVDNAADVARDTADIILLQKSLTVLHECVGEGRKVFGNVTKYIKMGTSSNFGNMLSLTAASFVLPFLPMAPIQILLNNLLYDTAQLSLTTDNVDADYLKKPRAWHTGFVKRYILLLGPISSIFDITTFCILGLIFKANVSAFVSVFQTGWFLESLLTQTLIVFVIRTAKIPFIQSWPSRFLITASVLVSLLGVAITFSPIAHTFGFSSLPPQILISIFGIVTVYLFVTQVAKTFFIRKFGFD